MGDSSLRRFVRKLNPGSTTYYDSGYKQSKAPMWGIPGITKDEGGPKRAPKPTSWNATNTRGAYFIKKNK